MEWLVKKLQEKNKTISTMESCTGGGVANAITNIAGASDVLQFSAVTYSNKFKIKMGVSKEVIEKYSVYSMETAAEMSKAISCFTGSDYGVGITGKLNRVDKNNLAGADNKVFISIYNKENDSYSNQEWVVTKKTRKENKEELIKIIEEKLLELL